MNIIKKHYAIKQCQKLNELISTLKDIFMKLKVRNTGENKVNNVNVKYYRDNGDGTMDWVDCPVIFTNGNKDGTTEE